MRICKVCDKKHHAKGYCKTHYRSFVLKPNLYNTECAVEGCKNSISFRFTLKKLCEKHGTRLIRHGSVAERTRAREIASIVDELKAFKGSLYEYEMPNRNTWAQIAKILFGNKCERCGWDKGTCDVHHRIYHRKGGKNTLSNAEIICPNCHRLEHQKKSNYYSTETKELIKNVFKEE